MRAVALENTTSTSPSSAASAAMASPSRTSRHAALDAGDGGAARVGRGGLDALRVTAGQQDEVVRGQAGGEAVDERAAEPLVGAGYEGDTGRGHALTVGPEAACEKRE
jgi:hypothetical protein